MDWIGLIIVGNEWFYGSVPRRPLEKQVVLELSYSFISLEADHVFVKMGQWAIYIYWTNSGYSTQSNAIGPNLTHLHSSLSCFRIRPEYTCDTCPSAPGFKPKMSCFTIPLLFDTCCYSVLGGPEGHHTGGREGKKYYHSRG